MSEAGAVLIGPYRQGEIPPPIVVTFKDALAAPVNISGYAVRWIYRQHLASGWPDYVATDPASVTQAGILVGGGSGGQAQYTWVAADFAVAGYFEGEMWIGNGANRYASIRYMWVVNAAIAVPVI